MDLRVRTGVLLVLFLFHCSGSLGDDTLQCDKSNPCYCITTNGSFINLSPLASANSGARFNEEWKEGKETVLQYNPCKPFEGENDCKDAAACLEIKSRGGARSSYLISKQDARWSLENQPSVKYGDNDRNLEVKLECNHSVSVDTSTLEVLSVNNYSVTAKLTSICACYGECGPLPDEPAGEPDAGRGLSAGSILVILFFTSLVVYLLAGMIYKKILHGATGKELIPNVEFWTAFPKLVLDGVAFTCNCCRKKQGTSGYDDM